MAADVAPGEALFARYALPPNELGYCGPPGAGGLLAVGASAGSGEAVRARAPEFDGAWPYLSLLAGRAGAPDPLDTTVVSSYWLGGGLCDQVAPGDLLDEVQRVFVGQPGVMQRLAQVPDVATGGPSHLFHVFVVYPWVGLLGAGGDAARMVLDRCRVRWGRVRRVDDENVVVTSRRLAWDGRVLSLAAPREETCRWARDGHVFVADLRAGDRVAMHWDWVCDRLGPEQVARLHRGTAQRLAVTNAWLATRASRPAPATAARS